MHGQKPVTILKDIIYIYDGSLAGFYCCVYESVYGKEMPMAIEDEENAMPTLFLEKMILSDMEKAQRVRDSIKNKISPRCLELVENVFLSALNQKELCLLQFILLGYGYGAQITDMLGNKDVAPIIKAENHLLHESHLYTGFIRFTDYDGILVSEISPKNFVLPYLMNHFINRFINENFMIYDKTHQTALIYENKKPTIMYLEELTLLSVSDKEENYRTLWKRFYNTIAIEERINPKCRMTHMPKRYWKDMVEMKEFL